VAYDETLQTAILIKEPVVEVEKKKKKHNTFQIFCQKINIIKNFFHIIII
jgi:hypothetical protein